MFAKHTRIKGTQYMGHGRRIMTEEKAKVVASVGGKEFIKFLAAHAILPRTILNNRLQDDMKEKDEFHPILQNRCGHNS